MVMVLEIAGNALRYLQQIVLARLAGPAAFGLYAVANSYAALLGIPVGLGLSSAVIRFVGSYRATAQWDRFRGLVHRSTRITLWSGVLVAAVATIVLAFVDVAPGFRMTLLLAFVLVPVTQMSVLQAAVLRGCGRLFASRVVPNVVQPVLVVGTAAVIAMLAGSLTSSGIMIGVATGALVGIGFQYSSLRRPMAPEDQRRERSFETRRWLRVAYPLLLVQAFQVCLSSSDIVLVGLLVGTDDAGIYAAANRTAMLAGLLATGINLAVSPSVALAEGHNDRAALQRLLHRCARYSFWMSMAVSIVMVALSAQLMGVFGPGFASANVGLSVMVLGRLFAAATGPVGMVLGITGHERVAATVFGVAAVLQLVLDLLLIPPFGILGAAIAAAVTMVAWQGALWVLTSRLLHLRLWPLRARAV